LNIFGSSKIKGPKDYSKNT